MPGQLRILQRFKPQHAVAQTFFVGAEAVPAPPIRPIKPVVLQALVGERGPPGSEPAFVDYDALIAATLTV